MVIELRGELAELERLAGELDRFAAEHGLGDRTVFDLHLALDEVFTNVVHHAYEGSGEHPVRVRFECRDGEVTVEVEDHGPAFNPLEAPPPDLAKPLEERRAGGLGIYLVRRVMDDLEYRREAERNVLRMRKAVGG